MVSAAPVTFHGIHYLRPLRGAGSTSERLKGPHLMVKVGQGSQLRIAPLTEDELLAIISQAAHALTELRKELNP